MIVGVVPGRREKECEAAGVLITDLGKRTDEAIRVMKTLWTEPEASFSGRFHNFSKIQMMPQPVQKPHPQIWIGGTTPATFSRVARLGDGWIPAFLSPAQIQAGLQEIQRRTKEKKRDPSKITCSAENFIAIISPGATDLETVSTYFQSRYKSTDDGLKVNIVGKPTEIIKRIEEYIQAGTNHFELRFVARTMDGVAESMKIFSREIAPSFS